MYLESPWNLLLLLLLLPLLFFLRGSRSLRWSSLTPAGNAGSSWRTRLAWLPSLLLMLSLVPLVVVLAKPKEIRETLGEVHQAVAIMSVVDISSSMTLTRYEFKRKQLNRLEIAKEVLRNFIVGDGNKLLGRQHDIIGLVSYARYPNSVCPPMIEHEPLLYFVDHLETDERPGEDGTAIGEAILLASANLANLNEKKQKAADGQRYQVKSKVVVLLTDGQNNCGQHDPIAAAEKAKEWGIKLHIIGFEDEDEEAVAENERLADAAKLTGGIFRTVHNGDELQSVYQEIDAMEKSEIREEPELKVCDYYRPFAYSSVAMLAMGLVLATTVLRRTP